VLQVQTRQHRNNPPTRNKPPTLGWQPTRQPTHLHNHQQLSRLEGKPGTAERPLSDLGAVSFRSYWQRAVLDCLRENQKGDITIQVRAGGGALVRALCVRACLPLGGALVWFGLV